MPTVTPRTGSDSDATRPLARWWTPPVWFAAYLLSGVVVFLMQGDIAPSLWYPPLAVGVAALLTFGWRALPVVFVADFLVTLPTNHRELAAPLVVALCTAIECSVAYHLLRRTGVTLALQRARDVPLALLIAGFVATFAGSSVGTILLLVYHATMRAQALPFWLNWWLGDAMSVVVLLPALLLWLSPPDPAAELPAPGGRREQFVLVLSGVVLGVAGMLSPALGDAREGLPWLGLGVTIVLWAAVRFSRRTTASMVAMLSAATVFVVRGEFLLNKWPKARLMMTLHTAQLDVVLLSIGGIALNTLITRERRARHDLELAAEALRRSALDRSMAARAGRLGTWEVDPLTGITWSDELYEMLGYPPQSFDPAAEPRLYLPDAETRQMLDERMVQHVASGEWLEFELPLRAGDGRRLWCEVRGEGIERDGRRVLVGTVADVTERRVLEQQFLQSQKMEVVGRLAGGVAHDFNNVLTAILGFTELAALNVESTSPARESLSQIRQAALRAAALTQRLLAFSRVQPLEPAPVELDALVVRLEPMLQRLLGEDVRMTLALGAPGRCVLADETQIEQVLMNLVVNARDAMPDGGRLEVSTREVEHAGAPLLRLSVTDTGSGMDEQTRSRIFEPFFTTKSPGQGTGLGLSTVHAIVKQAGGHVTVESRPGEGSAFVVDLPVHGAPAATAPEARADRPSPRGRESLLVVEDDALVREYVRSCLVQAGYDVVTAASGELAMAAAGRMDAPPDLLLTDVTMPGMNGVELARRLRQRHPALPLLFMSGYTRMFEPGGDAEEFAGQALAKPFSGSELLERVRSVLDGVRA